MNPRYRRLVIPVALAGLILIVVMLFLPRGVLPALGAGVQRLGRAR